MESECPDVYIPEIITRGCQKYAVGLNGSTLHLQHHVKQDATLPENQQSVHQAPNVRWTSVGFAARAVWRTSAPRSWTQLSFLSHSKTRTLGLHRVHLSTDLLSSRHTKYSLRRIKPSTLTTPRWETYRKTRPVRVTVEGGYQLSLE